MINEIVVMAACASLYEPPGQSMLWIVCGIELTGDAWLMDAYQQDAWVTKARCSSY
jgi:hypothetical protein